MSLRNRDGKGGGLWVCTKKWSLCEWSWGEGRSSIRLLQDLKFGQSLMGDRKDSEKSPAWCVHYGSLVESVSTYQQVILTQNGDGLEGKAMRAG